MRYPPPPFMLESAFKIILNVMSIITIHRFKWYKSGPSKKAALYVLLLRLLLLFNNHQIGKHIILLKNIL